MKSKLLSIVVPTKDRAEYLKSLIRIVTSFNRNDVELVIEDNSEDNSVIKTFLEENSFDNVVYNYEQKKLSVVENSDRAILHSSGRYVSFIGDDDGVSSYICEFVEFMESKEYDSAIFHVAQYYWPGIEFRAHHFPNLIIEKYKGGIHKVDVKKELQKVMHHGATSLEKLPKVYHGIILRARLDEIYKDTGTYFPGPSPDMANAIALATVVKRHIYYDMPLIIAGASPKSTAGLGTRHKHEGDLKDIDFLPQDTEKIWNEDILKVWTGPTIYAQSALSALDYLKEEDLKKEFNYNYHYAFMTVFCSSYYALIKRFLKTSQRYNSQQYFINVIRIFTYRVNEYIKNILHLKFKYNVILKDNIVNMVDVCEYIDRLVEKNKINC